jgi:hypothetical protein
MQRPLYICCERGRGAPSLNRTAPNFAEIFSLQFAANFSAMVSLQ